MLLFAVHLNDGVLDWPWLVGGLVLMAAMLAVAGRNLNDREIPRIGVLTAAFFVASQVHIPLGGVSVHLLLNGLLGVVLRLRATLAITVGLVMQTLLFGHGGFIVLGVNTCTQAIPAVLAGYMMTVLRLSRVATRARGRSLGVFFVALVWIGLALTAVQFLVAKTTEAGFDYHEPPPLWVLNPYILVGTVFVSGFLACLERKLEANPDFALGLFVGIFAAGFTVVLVGAVLGIGGKGDLGSLALLQVVMHVPVIALEGVGVGFAVAVLAKAKPEWLGRSA